MRGVMGTEFFDLHRMVEPRGQPDIDRFSVDFLRNPALPSIVDQVTLGAGAILQSSLESRLGLDVFHGLNIRSREQTCCASCTQVLVCHIRAHAIRISFSMHMIYVCTCQP